MEEEVVHLDGQLLVLLPVHHREFNTSISEPPAPRWSGRLIASKLLPLQDKDPIGIIPLEDLCVRTLHDAGKPVAAAAK